MQTWDCLLDPNGNPLHPQQTWRYFSDGTLQTPNGRCLDADLGTIASNGTKVQMWDCLPNAANQKWDLINNRVVSRRPEGRCLDVPIGDRFDNGVRLQLWDCIAGDRDNQHWVHVD